MASKIYIVTVNVNGIRNDIDRLHTFQNLTRLGADIFLLQETHSVPTDRRRWTREWGEISRGGKIYFSHTPQSDSRGVAILTNGTFDHKPIDHFSDQDGRIPTLTLKTQDTQFQIFNV